MKRYIWFSLLCLSMSCCYAQVTNKPIKTKWNTLGRGGLQYQLILPKQEISIDADSLLVLIQVCNRSNQVQQLKSIRPVYTPHGRLELYNEKGEAIIKLRCKKKHAYGVLELKPKEKKVWKYNLFRMSCTKLDRKALVKGKYTVKFNKSKVQLTVVDK
ncbi:MAG: hypothetical protein GY810_02435 [Aureispira sp.]|nr:hypothetical protein [Aureispira sp.]